MSEIIPLLSRLIAARTHNPGGDEVALAQLLHGELLALGPDSLELVRVPRGKLTGAYVVARWGAPRLLVNAHLDTVPPNDGWSGDPFVARRVSTPDGERIVGLGSADTKGAVAAILSALTSVQPRDTAVVFSGDEELENTCMHHLIDSSLLTLGEGGIERAIVCEPTSLRPGTRHRGIMAVEISLQGQGGHSSRADTSPRPLAELARLALRFDEWGQARKSEGPPGFPGMCMNVAKLDGGVAFNVIPERGMLTISLRPPPGSDVRTIRAEIDAIVVRTLPSAQVRWVLDSPPFETRHFEHFASLLRTPAEAPVDLGFWTEAALLSRAGVDAVVIGPGDIAQAHAPDEWVGVDELGAARAMFVDLFRESSHQGAHGTR